MSRLAAQAPGRPSGVSFGPRSPNLRRAQALPVNLSVLRTFRLSEGHRVQLQGSAFNLTNPPAHGAPSNSPASPLFGVAPIPQINLPRAVELGARYFA